MEFEKAYAGFTNLSFGGAARCDFLIDAVEVACNKQDLPEADIYNLVEVLDSKLEVGDLERAKAIVNEIDFTLVSASVSAKLQHVVLAVKVELGMELKI